MNFNACVPQVLVKYVDADLLLYVLTASLASKHVGTTLTLWGSRYIYKAVVLKVENRLEIDRR